MTGSKRAIFSSTLILVVLAVAGYLAARRLHEAAPQPIFTQAREEQFIRSALNYAANGHGLRLTGDHVQDRAMVEMVVPMSMGEWMNIANPIGYSWATPFTGSKYHTVVVVVIRGVVDTSQMVGSLPNPNEISPVIHDNIYIVIDTASGMPTASASFSPGIALPLYPPGTVAALWQPDPKPQVVLDAVDEEVIANAITYAISRGLYSTGDPASDRDMVELVVTLTRQEWDAILSRTFSTEAAELGILADLPIVIVVIRGKVDRTKGPGLPVAEVIQPTLYDNFYIMVNPASKNPLGGSSFNPGIILPLYDGEVVAGGSTAVYSPGFQLEMAAPLPVPTAQP